MMPMMIMMMMCTGYITGKQYDDEQDDDGKKGDVKDGWMERGD